MSRAIILCGKNETDIRDFYYEHLAPKGFRRICPNELGSLSIVDAAIAAAVNSDASFVVDGGRLSQSGEKRYVEKIYEMGCERVECWYLHEEVQEVLDEKVIEDTPHAARIVLIMTSNNTPGRKIWFENRKRPVNATRDKLGFIDMLFMADPAPRGDRDGN